MTFQELERGINEASVTQIPALLILVVRRALKLDVYQTGKLPEAVAAIVRRYPNG